MNDKEMLFKISLLISMSLSGNITKEEQAELDLWREESEYNKKLFEQICSETVMREKLTQYKSANVQTALIPLSKKRETTFSSTLDRKVVPLCSYFYSYPCWPWCFIIARKRMLK